MASLRSNAASAIAAVGHLRQESSETAAASAHTAAAARCISSSCRPPPSKRTQKLASELLALPPDELKDLRLLCRERLTPKLVGAKGRPPKDYNPSLKERRSDRPLPLRASLRALGQRFPAMHPLWIFAGSGPGVMPAPMPALTHAIMGQHYAGIIGDAATVDVALPQATPASVPEATPEVVDDEAEPTAVPDAPAEAAKPLKATVSLRLLGFEASKKITVIKEVRALLGEGLKESKELVERAPVTLRKAVQRSDAEAQAEKLRAAGADIALE
eukprot:CAMPEP_0117607440 /NCGR_PEP_ID=MMETSP0784-20121206/80254_1 /TAXON_ID=39447 /ORGANISM="" /LENGTH=272 /DNA_ID=CAMNT_0005410603 /DNA_START=41 /DNA_END=860 /DNA_ORIENTATION=+